MKKIWSHPVIEFIKMLDRQEKKACSRHIMAHSEVDNTQLITLWDHIYTGLAKSKKHDFDTHTVFKSIFKKEKFDNKKLSKLAYKLKQLIIEYMSFAEFQRDENQINLQFYFAKSLLRKKQYNLHVSTLKKIDKQLSQYLYEEENIELLDAQNQEELIFQTKGNKVIMDPSNFNQLSAKYLDFYFLKNSKIGAELSSRSLYITEDFQLPLLEPTLQRSKDPDSPLLLHLYGQVIEMNIHFSNKNYAESKEIYQMLKQHLYLNFTKLQIDNKMHLCVLLRNYLINYHRSVDASILEEIFDFNKFVLEKRVFIENGIFTYESLVNVFNPALLLKKFKYAQQFLDTYIDLLAPNEQEKTRLYCQANLYYMQKKFDKIEPLLDRLILLDWKFYILVNQTLLKALFVQSVKRPKPILSKIAKLESQLNTSKKINKTQKSFKCYLSILKRLVQFRQKNGTLQGVNPEEVLKFETIKKDIERLEDISTKSWLKKVADSFK